MSLSIDVSPMPARTDDAKGCAEPLRGAWRDT